jgi:hypothetical protein
MSEHTRTVVHLPADGINPPTRVTLCSCGDRTCRRYTEEDK